MGIFAHMSIKDTKCCSTCVGCRKATKLIEYYTKYRNKGISHWILYDRKTTSNGMDCLLWGLDERPKCQVFSATSRETRYASISDGDPYVLAYVDLYAPKNVTTGRFGSY